MLQDSKSLERYYCGDQELSRRAHLYILGIGQQSKSLFVRGSKLSSHKLLIPLFDLVKLATQVTIQ